MLLRVLSFVVVLAGAALAGWKMDGWRGAASGLGVGGVGWFTADLWRGWRAVHWLRDPAAAAAPRLGGLWGEAVERARRALRLREQDARAQAARLTETLAAIQASPNGVTLLDDQGRIEWCNDAAATHFGFDPARDVQQHIGNLVRDPGFLAYAAAGDFAHEVALPGRGDSPGRPVRLSVQLHPYGDGRRLLLSRDVTAVAQAEAMRRDFVANVSHEIRTPLTVLAGFIETLQTLDLDEAERAHFLTLMAQQSDRMRALVNDLLTLSSLEGAPLPGATEVVPVAELTSLCEDEARALSALLLPPPAAPQQLLVQAPEGLALAGSARELRSALSNLVNNAVRYTPAGGLIRVDWARLPDGRLEVAVSDTGPGIAPEHIPRLTERFYRVDRSRSRESGGTGLGLAIVKHVAQRHGGELRITSTLGRGSRFALVFPVQRVRDVPVSPGDASPGAA